MNLPKAIETLRNYPPGASPDNSWEFNAAILLGIEAMKAISYFRSLYMPGICPKLPGETEE